MYHVPIHAHRFIEFGASVTIEGLQSIENNIINILHYFITGKLIINQTLLRYFLGQRFFYLSRILLS